MKKILVSITSVVFLLAALAFAADKPATDVTKNSAVKANVIKNAKMNARGKVVEVSDKAIKIERSIKGNTQIMEFALDKPAENIAVNDSVKIDYSDQDGKLIASRVAKQVAIKKVIKKEAAVTTDKPASGVK
jgi:hypothetical protein